MRDRAWSWATCLIVALAWALPGWAQVVAPVATAAPEPTATAPAAAPPPTTEAPAPPAAEASSAPSPTPQGAAEATNAAALAQLQADNRALADRVAQLETAQADAAAAQLEDTNVSELLNDPFHVYGFADFGVNHAWVPRESFLNGLALEETTFTLGNLNLYFDFQPGPSWQVLAEIRFTTYPHGDEVQLGSPLGQAYQRTDTSVLDVASPATSNSFRWGGILIERAYAQWTYSEKLSVRVGQFLTPYGIWNVDHGTPTLIALMLPHFVAAEVMPERQIGVELHGALLGSSWELGYNAYVSNGRTATQVDFTEDKAFGLRLSASRRVPLPMTFGASFYYGAIDDIEKNVTSFDPFRVERDLTVQGTEVSGGVDVSLDVGALRIRAEGVTRSTRYEPGKRPRLNFGPPGALRSDTNEYDSYLLFAYRLPWLGLEPYLYGELDHAPSLWGDEQAVIAPGFNVHFTPFAQLKTQVARVLFFDLDDAGAYGVNDLWLLFSRLAVAF